MLQQVMQDTLPDAAELVTPPLRVAGSSSTDLAAPAAAGPASQQQQAMQSATSAGQPRPPYSLREGVGMRRLVKFRVQAGVQLLLVQAASEVYALHYHHMAVSVWVNVCNSHKVKACHFVVWYSLPAGCCWLVMCCVQKHPAIHWYNLILGGWYYKYQLRYCQTLYSYHTTLAQVYNQHKFSWCSSCRYLQWYR